MNNLANELNLTKDREYSKGLEQDAFGTSDPSLIVGYLSSKIFEELKSYPVTLRFFAASAALVYGFKLEDERDIVLKVFPSDWDEYGLLTSREIQLALFDTGYPITKPLGNILSLVNSFATIDAYKQSPTEPQEITQQYLKRLAVYLVELIDLIKKLKIKDSESLSSQFGWTKSQRWGRQVRPEVNLDDKPEGAEWIEELGEEARKMCSKPVGRKVTAHDDWLPHNVRPDTNLNLEVVYDWDSLCRGLETVFVGKACGAATSEDLNFFIDSYEEASGHIFNRKELRTIAGTTLWMRAFLARWEQSQSDSKDGYLRSRLKKDSKAILDLPNRAPRA